MKGKHRKTIGVLAALILVTPPLVFLFAQNSLFLPLDLSSFPLQQRKIVFLIVFLFLLLFVFLYIWSILWVLFFLLNKFLNAIKRGDNIEGSESKYRVVKILAQCIKVFIVFCIVFPVAYLLPIWGPFFTYLTSVAVYGAPTAEYNSVFQEGVKEGYHLLIKRGYCLSEQLCQKRDYMLFKSHPDGIEGNFYGIKNKEIINDLFKIFTKKFDKNSQIERLYIAAYGFPKNEDKIFQSDWFPIAIPIRKWTEGYIMHIELKKDHNNKQGD